MTLDELGDLIDAVEARRKTIIVYAATENPDVAEQFTTRNVAVEHRPLPGGEPSGGGGRPGEGKPSGVGGQLSEAEPPGFVVLREHDAFVGAIGVEGLEALLAPPLVRPWDETLLSGGYRALFELLDETLFVSFDRRQLLFAAREIEERAWRVGHGTLRVGFQSLSAMEPQLPVYERFAAERHLDVHVYGSADWSPPDVPGLAVHAEEADEIGRFWLLAFDGGDDARQACGLLAEERSPGEFYGFWTYDPDTVDELQSYLAQTYG